MFDDAVDLVRAVAPQPQGQVLACPADGVVAGWFWVRGGRVGLHEDFQPGLGPGAVNLAVAGNRTGVPPPQHHLVGPQQRSGGGIVAFEVRGGRQASWRVIDATRLLSITANLGDTKTTITHPATTTHGRLSQEERAFAGISQGLIRIAVGLEDIADIQRDLRGLAG